MSVLIPNPSFALKENGRLYEVVDGERVEKIMGAREVSIANVLCQLIVGSLGQDLTGQFFVEMPFSLAPGLDRRPDLAFVPYERWPDRVVPDVEAWPIIPALVAEVVSKSNSAVGIEQKLDEYFAHGVEMVWVVYPKQRKVYVYDSPTSVKILSATDKLSAGSVIPKLQLPLGVFFAR